MLQGAEKLYGGVVKPLFANVHAKASTNGTSTTSIPEATVQADTLRDRAAYATSE